MTGSREARSDKLGAYLNVDISTLIELDEEGREVILTHGIDVIVPVFEETGSYEGQVQFHFIRSDVV